MTKTNNFLDKWGMTIICVLLILMGIYYLGLTTYKIFNPTDEKITFNVIGITNSSNATTIVSLHFECIKYCIDHTSNEYNSRDKCYQECSLLGK